MEQLLFGRKYLGQAKGFTELGEKQNPVDSKAISDIVVPVTQVLVMAANVTIVIVTAVMAIKYMTGNPEEKGKLKTQLIGLVISTIVVFGAQFIWRLLYEFLK